jgi:hypothetical protein
MGLFFKKKEEPKKDGDPLRKDLLEKCLQNTSNIIAKIVNKRLDYYKKIKVPPELEEEVDKKFQEMVEYMQRVDWPEIIDGTLKNAKLADVDGNFSNLHDPETAKALLNLQWQSIKEDINRMINDVIMLTQETK